MSADEPIQLIDTDDPILGMAQHYLLCPSNHSSKIMGELLIDECREHEAIVGRRDD